MVLPTPLGPRSKRLCPLATKPRVHASSTISRGMARGGGEDVGAVQVEQVRGLGDHEADVAAGFDPALEEDVEAGDGGVEPVTPLGLTGGALVLEDLRAVLGRLDALVSSPAAVVP